MAIPTGPNEKVASRQEAKRLLGALSAEQAAAWSELIVQHLAGWLTNDPLPGPVAIFAALPGEPDLGRLQGLCPDQGWLYPLVGPEQSLTFHAVGSPDTLQAGSFGILEPDPERHPEVSPEDIGAVLCPGLAFATTGTRLGRGKGFYDRLLGILPAGRPRVGVAFGVQLAVTVPAEPHDVPMTHLVTESGLVGVTPPAAPA